GLARIAVDNRALLLFLEAAFARGKRLWELHRARDILVIESVSGTGIFNEVYIGTSLFQPCDVIAAWADRHPVVGNAVVKPDRLGAHLLVREPLNVEVCISTDVGR